MRRLFSRLSWIRFRLLRVLKRISVFWWQMGSPMGLVCWDLEIVWLRLEMVEISLIILMAFSVIFWWLREFSTKMEKLINLKRSLIRRVKRMDWEVCLIWLRITLWVLIERSKILKTFPFELNKKAKAFFNDILLKQIKNKFNSKSLSLSKILLRICSKRICITSK